MAASSLDGTAYSTTSSNNPLYTSPAMATVTIPSGGQYSLVKTPTSTSQSSLPFSQSGSNPLPINGLTVPALPPAPSGMLQNPNTVYQQIYDVSSKRISTLDYLRKA